MTTPGAVRVADGMGPGRFGELTLPAGSARVPVVVVVHGGSWRARHGLELGRPLAIDLAARGVAAWNVEHGRVGPGGTDGPDGARGWPTTLTDVAAAVDALAGPVAAAAPGRLDLADVRGVGRSAGGHLVAWAASRHLLPAAPRARGRWCACAGSSARPGCSTWSAPTTSPHRPRLRGLGSGPGRARGAVTSAWSAADGLRIVGRAGQIPRATTTP